MSLLYCFYWQRTFAVTNENDTVMVDISAGTLYANLDSYYNGGYDTRHLIVKGKMNGFDFQKIRNICWKVNIANGGNLRSADISDVRVVGRKNDVYKVTTDNTLNQGIFDDFNLDYIVLPKSLKLIKENTFDDNADIEEIWFYATDSLFVEKNAFSKKCKVNIITENQIPNETYDGINEYWYTGWPSVTVYVPKGCVPEYNSLFELYHGYAEYNKYERSTATPQIIVDENNLVSILCENPNAKIYYKIDDTDATNYWAISKAPETEYDGSFSVSKNCTIKAFAVCENEDYSDISFLEISSFVTQPPKIEVDSLVATSYTTVTLSHQEEDVVIYYTTDGTDPTENSTIYTGPFKVERSMTVKAAALKDAFKMSDVVSADIEIKVATPTAEYGYYGGIYINCSTPGAKFYYTTDGSEPTVNSVDYDDENYNWGLGLYPGLNCILKNYGGGPVGADTLAAALSEERDTIEEVIEPFLLKLGFLQRTPRGRVISDLGCDYLGAPRIKKGMKAAPTQFDLLSVIEEEENGF